MSGRRKMAWLLAASVVAGAACGRGGEVQTGVGGAAGSDDTELVQRSVARALMADTYRIRVGINFGESTGDQATGRSVCGVNGTSATRDLAVGDKGHRTALLDSRSGAVRVLRDDLEPAVYLATSTLPGAGGTSAEWARVGPGDFATGTGLAAVAVELFNDLAFTAGMPTDHGLLTVLQRSAAVVTAVDRGEIDGVGVSHQHITVDRERFAAAEQDQMRSTRTGIAMLGIPPGATETFTSPGEPLPTFDTWVDDAGTLRRVATDGFFPSGSDAHRLRLDVTYVSFDAAFPAPVPSPGSVTDLGSLPASVLLPLPDCLGSRALPLSGGDLPPAMIDAFREYARCVTESVERAAAGKTVTQWLGDTNALAISGACPPPDLSSLAGGPPAK